MGWNDHIDAVESAHTNLRKARKRLEVLLHGQVCGETAFPALRAYLLAATATGPHAECMPPLQVHALIQTLLALRGTFVWRTQC